MHEVYSVHAVPTFLAFLCAEENSGGVCGVALVLRLALYGAGWDEDETTGADRQCKSPWACWASWPAGSGPGIRRGQKKERKTECTDLLDLALGRDGVHDVHEVDGWDDLSRSR